MQFTVVVVVYYTQTRPLRDVNGRFRLAVQLWLGSFANCGTISENEANEDQFQPNCPPFTLLEVELPPDGQGRPVLSIKFLWSAGKVDTRVGRRSV